ncbi:Binding-protein-dependent transport systems inner membrane component [Bifidobacterium ramosum]|uniref:ABC transporter permease subunit n=1 Tax=Bifidobacterium ramosum TaxID=1798158 RepID=A0A6L4WYS1_9BIFI|nr:sugar ABC transporter permease [Bifidobacterium ramosum]KAB8287176.1 Binding-protein-dependent transport systems inner membrane component [Bifidobacterium ramosum]NEG71892.1 ABC transporter permease subunit [Bifidobacterium ramosum]
MSAVTKAAKPRKERRGLTRKTREAIAFYACVSPWIFGFVVFTAIPMVASLYLSFTDWDSFQSPNFVGFANYVKAFTKDPLFWKVLGHTFYYACVSVPLSLLIALYLSNLLSNNFRGKRAFRTIIYLPSLVPLVSAGLIFKWLLKPEDGPINAFLSIFGIKGPAWLLDTHWVIPAIILLSLWQVGGGTILLISAINGVPKELYEAAEIDGAGHYRMFWNITFPMITPILFFNLVTGIIGAFQVFDQVYILTEGGPDNASQMMVPYIYTTAFKNFQMGYASALAWILFVIIMIISALVLRSSSAWVFYESEVKK